MRVSSASITAMGSYVPGKVLSNKHLEMMVDTNDNWIVRRTGITERRVADELEFTSHLCVKAVENLLENYSKSVSDVDMIIVCTLTPDFKTPSVASYIQSELNIKRAGSIDLNAACAGFTYGLHIANGLITAGLHKKVLVVAAETLTKITDYKDRSTCILFGDGAGAALVEHNLENYSFISSFLDTNGEEGKNLYSTNLSTKMGEHELHPSGSIVQNGREVYKWAVRTVPTGIEDLLGKANMTKDKIDWFIPHSANMRMIESICERSGISMEKTLLSVERYGNTSSASIPLALDHAIKQGKIKSGDTMLLYGFGGGLTQCGLILNWTC